jgi:class 3 adenylate cyclase/tetratricopeptide (TPR) repeat protein
MRCPGCAHENPAGAKFCGECGARLQSPGAAPAAARYGAPESYTPKHLADKILTSSSALAGERKVVSVMFADVSGFTAMSERLDPEEVHAIMDRAFEVILNEVHRYEGTINQFLGDGVMALFGAPVAHEDHAHRALSAALSIQAALKPLAEEVHRVHAVEFRMRMGINTGFVVVGAIGKDLRMDYTAVGDTTNLAARLLGIAAPGQIVVSRRTQHLRSGFFVFEDLGEFQLKGKADAVRAYALIREISGRTRLEVSRERGLTPLVGRSQELASLVAIYRRAAAGEGAMALLVGEPGVGKSRLLYEFLRQLERAGAIELETTCLSYGRAMAYRPIVELVRRYLALPDGVSGEDLRRRVTEQLVLVGLDGEEQSVLLAHFLGASAPPEFLNRLSAVQLKERTLGVLRDVFLRASESAPLIIIVENLYWIDSASEEFLAHLAAGVAGHRILIVLTTRPGYATPWLGAAPAQTIDLAGLGTGEINGMVRTLLGAQEISSELFELLSDKSEGNPLYVEEILRQLQETGGISVVAGTAQLGRKDVTIPATIHDIIAARVDRLAETLKQILQAAAVLGRRFRVSLVARILEIPAEKVAEHLRELHGVDFIFPSAQQPELMYSFKHALTQDVVYGGVLERRRRTYHAAAAVGYEALFAGRVHDVVELIAHHFARGQVWDRAAIYLRQAAAKAQARSAHREALASLEEGLAALGHLPDTPQRREHEIDIRVELRGSLYPLGQFDKMLGHLREAETMAAAIGDRRRLALVSIHTAEYFRQTGRFAEARTLAEQALELGEKLHDVPLKLYASHYLGLACHALGDYRRACEVLRAVTLSPPAEWRPGAIAGMVTGSWAAFQSTTLAWFARCLAECGEFTEALDAGRRAVALADEVGSPYSLAAAYIGLGYSHLVKGDTDAARSALERACNIAGEANLPLLRPQAARMLGSAHLAAGRIEEGASLVRAAADEVESGRLLMQQAAVLVLLGEALLSAGRADEASKVVRTALGLARERGQRGDEAAALRALGEIETAEQHYLAAITLAEELGMRPLLARSHLGLSRLYLGAGKRKPGDEHSLAAKRLLAEMGIN